MSDAHRAVHASSSRRRSPTPAWRSCASASTSTSASTGTTSSSPSGSATTTASSSARPRKLTADLIARGDKLKVIGRAGVGVDNVDVEAATKRGIIVANAPQSNVITAAEHTIALLLALARNVPQAHARARRRPLGALEVRRGRAVREDARAARLRPHRPARRRARAGLRHARRRVRPVRVGRAASASSASRRPSIVRRALRARGLHLDPPAEDARDRGLARRRGARQVQGRRADHQLRARPARRRRGAEGGARLRQGRGRRARRVPHEPVTDHPLFGYPNVVVTPHLGASTTEAQDRAGVQTAEQVVAALTGGVVSTAVNIPAVSAEDMDVLGPFLPLCRGLGRVGIGARRVARASTGSRSSTSAGSPSATRACSRSPVLNGVLAGHTDEEVNLVNAPALAEERGIAVVRDGARRARATSPTSCASASSAASSARASSARRSAARTVRTCSRRGASASTCRWTRATSRCSATRTCPA